jgi:hypothetical protein
MTATLHFLRSNTAHTAYTGSVDVDSAWHGADAAPTVVADTSVHVRVELATEDDVASAPQPVDEDPCEEQARRNFTRRELAEDLRRARAGHTGATSREPQEENDRTAIARDSS